MSRLDDCPGKITGECEFRDCPITACSTRKLKLALEWATGEFTSEVPEEL